jgi:ferredoxin
MVQIDRERCDVCGTCVSVCQVNALQIIHTLSVDESACISCGKCVTVCPFGALCLIEKETSEEQIESV